MKGATPSTRCFAFGGPNLEPNYDRSVGAFYAVHDDGTPAAFSRPDIAAKLDLRADCPVQGNAR